MSLTLHLRDIKSKKNVESLSITQEGKYYLL